MDTFGLVTEDFLLHEEERFNSDHHIPPAIRTHQKIVLCRSQNHCLAPSTCVLFN